jgi:hypothetical protein
MAMAVVPARAEGTALGKEMEAVDSAYKRLKKTEDAAEGVKEARAAQAAVLKSASLVPEMIGKMPAGVAKDKALASYKALLGEAYVLWCRVELAFLDGKQAEVPGLLDALKELRKKGHTQFIEEEE